MRKPDWYRWRFKTGNGWSKWIALEVDDHAAWVKLMFRHVITGTHELQALFAESTEDQVARLNETFTARKKKGG